MGAVIEIARVINSKSGHPEMLDNPLHLLKIWKGGGGAVIVIAILNDKLQTIKVLAVTICVASVTSSLRCSLS